MGPSRTRRWAVPDAPTTVLTMTLTGVAADLRNRDVRVAVRRLVAVAAMLIGALVGALLILHVGAATALIVGCGPVAVVLIGVTIASRTHAAWQTPA